MWGNEIFPAQVHFDLILSPPKEFFHIFAGRSDRFFDYNISGGDAAESQMFKNHFSTYSAAHMSSVQQTSENK